MMTGNTNLGIVKDVIKPRSAAEKKQRQMKARTVDSEEQPKPENIAEAAKKVAESLDGNRGNTKKIESELLSILMRNSDENGDHNLKYLKCF